jgi:hypothetical protein
MGDGGCVLATGNRPEHTRGCLNANIAGIEARVAAALWCPFSGCSGRAVVLTATLRCASRASSSRLDSSRESLATFAWALQALACAVADTDSTAFACWACSAAAAACAASSSPCSAATRSRSSSLSSSSPLFRS